MHRLLPRLPHLLASALVISAVRATPALSEPPAAPAPRAVTDPLHPCTVLLCLPGPGKVAEGAAPAPRDAASGLPTGKRMHKPYTATTPMTDAPSAACAASPDAERLKVASDPEEGGQIARTTKPEVRDMTVSRKLDTASPTLAETPPPAPAPCGAAQH